MPAAEVHRSFTSESPEQTRALGEILGELLEAGDFVGLIGELGAGKTELARGVAEGAGVPADEVASPTFAIVYTYQGRLPIHHADLYRLADEDELYATGFFDLFGGDGAVLVEWLDRIPSAAPEHERLILTLTEEAEDRRRIDASAKGGRHLGLLERWAEAIAVLSARR